MATTSYTWTPLNFVAPVNNVATAGDQDEPAIAANAAGTLYMTAWTNYVPDKGVMGRFFHGDGTPAGDAFTIADGPGYQFTPRLAALADGRFIAVYDDVEDIRARIYNPDGSLSQSIDIAVGPEGSRRPDVTALADGGFAVSWSRGTGDSDVATAVYNVDGSVRHAARHVAANAHDEFNPSIAGLAGGGYVVAWQEWDAGDSEVRFRTFDANGNALNGTDTQGVLIDHWGFNSNIRVAGLPDGGFVVAYQDDGWINGNGIDITAQVYNANGTARSSSSLANSDLVAGAQLHPTLAVMDDGHFVVGWTSHERHRAQVYDALGHKLGENTIIAVNVTDAAIAALGGSVIAHVGASLDTDGSGTSIRAAQEEFSRILSGNNSNETINGVGDGIREILLGHGGQDTLNGGAGDDMIEGGAGNDTIIGGTGHDSARFSEFLDQYVIYDFGSKIVVAGPDGFDQLFGIEHLDFAYAALDIVNDGNGLFDTLYYLSRNIDVFSAHANALDHFNGFGWHEGRDPNAFFDVSGYLAANKDVAAAGINPLDHYHQTGWQQGRDPSADFDTTLYLIHNPDVAAAGIDPLEHFLQYGAAEGRARYAAIGPVAGGFDAQYYLFHNPDVAAAGVDPLAHFNANGWHEGRNPNGYFNTAGYLSHYADVAAAGVNPLDHYMAFGWQEGRDPSAYFDTLGYLAANPDVSAAYVNPLDHFLQHGIYEGRAIVSDGVWH